MNSPSYEKIIGKKTRKLAGIISIFIFLIVSGFSYWMFEKRESDLFEGVLTHEENLSYLLNIGNQFELKRVSSNIENNLKVKISITTEGDHLVYGEKQHEADFVRKLKYNERVVGKLHINLINQYNIFLYIILIVSLIVFLLIYFTCFYTFKRNSDLILKPIISLFSNRGVNKDHLRMNEFILSREGKVLLNLINDNEKLIKDAALAEIALGVSHDLRSPVASLKAILDILETEKHNNLGSDKAKLIKMSIQRIEQISNDLLETKKKHESETKADKIIDWTNEVVCEKEREYNSLPNNLSLHIEVEKKLFKNTYFRMSESDYKRVISNLLNNSFESLDLNKKHNQILIMILIEKNNLKISIQDSGKGIENSVLKDINNGLVVTTKFDGNGIGLNLIKTKLQKINGKLQLYSELGRGTTVDILIPLFSTA